MKWRKWSDKWLVHLLSPNIYRTHSEALQAFRQFDKAGRWDLVFSDFQRKVIIYVGATGMYVIGKKGELIYQGAIDNFRETRNRDVSKNVNYLRQVLNAVLAGKPAPFAEKAPYGCSIKYARPRS